MCHTPDLRQPVQPRHGGDRAVRREHDARRARGGHGPARRRPVDAHDATAGFTVPPEGVWQWPAHAPAEVICHNDFAPYNLMFEGTELTGVIDFDLASPGPRVWDMGYTAYRFVPLTAPGNPDVAFPGAAGQARRLAAFCAAYGDERIGARRRDRRSDRPPARARRVHRPRAPRRATPPSRRSSPVATRSSTSATSPTSRPSRADGGRLHDGDRDDRLPHGRGAVPDRAQGRARHPRGHRPRAARARGQHRGRGPRAPAARARAARACRHVRRLPRPARRRRGGPRRALLAQGRLLDGMRARDDRARRVGGRVGPRRRARRRRRGRHDRRAVGPRVRARGAPRRRDRAHRLPQRTGVRRRARRARRATPRSTSPGAARSTPSRRRRTGGCGSCPRTCPGSSPPAAR